MQNIYSIHDVAVNAYLLERGSLTFTMAGGESYSVTGANLIFGISEILLGMETDILTNRFQTVTASDDSVYRTIPKNNLRKFMESYNVGFNMDKEMALSLKEINKLLEKRLNSMSDREKKSHFFAKEFAGVVNFLNEEFHKKRFPVLKTLFEEASNSLTYMYGLSLKQVVTKTIFNIESEVFDELHRTYKPEGVVCKQGQSGNELYIIVNGSLGVYVGDDLKEIDVISTPGEVIGEMSLLLGEPRTATLKAVTETILTVVSKDDLKEVAVNKPDFFIKIGLTLSKRLRHSCRILETLKRKVDSEEKPESLIVDPHHEQFTKLERAVLSAFNDHDLPILEEILNMFQTIRDKIPG